MRMEGAVALLSALLLVLALTACGKQEEEKNPNALADGVYTAAFATDSKMFYANKEHGGRGILTVKEGKMTLHVTLSGTGFLNVFPGTAEDAQKEGAELLYPSRDPVTYSDGLTDICYGYDIPVPYLDQDFSLATVGSKGTWYDHAVSVSDVKALEEPLERSCAVTLTGGTGKASVTSPLTLTKGLDGHWYATVVWSSPNYDFMMVNGTKFLPVNKEGDSAFFIPVELDVDLAVSADTTAMSEPHLIDYVLHLDGSTLK